jgi:hypothetical protein
VKSYIIALIVILTSITGCGTNYVSKDRKLEVNTNNKPVFGVVSYQFYTNSRPSASMDKLLAYDFSKYLSTNGINSIYIDGYTDDNINKSAYQFANSEKVRFKLPGEGDINWASARSIGDGSKFDNLETEFKKYGIDGLIILGGYASNPTLSALAATAAADKLITGAFNIQNLAMAGATNTPGTILHALILNKNGEPIYYNKVMFTKIFRRNFGDEDERRRMYDYVFGDIKEKLLLN